MVCLQKYPLLSAKQEKKDINRPHRKELNAAARLIRPSQR